MGGKVVVTGGSGFVGSHLVRALQERGYGVTILDTAAPRHTPDVSFVCASITDRQLVSKIIAGADAVFHLAAVLGTQETVEAAYHTAEVNILGTLNVLDAARVAGAAVLFVTKPNYWVNPYTITKVAAETFCAMYRDEFAMNVRSVRCYNIYGPCQRTEDEGYKKALPTFIVNALRGEPLTINGDGTQGADYIYVTDAIAAIIACYESSFASQGAVEVGSGEAISINGLAQAVLQLTGSKSEIRHVPMRSGESGTARIFADVSVLRERIGIVPKIDLNEGLRQTIDYYRPLYATSKAV